MSYSQISRSVVECPSYLCPTAALCFTCRVEPGTSVPQMVVTSIDTYLSAAAGEQYNGLRNTLWRTIEDEITPKGKHQLWSSPYCLLLKPTTSGY